MKHSLNPHFDALLPLWSANTQRFALVRYGAGIVQMSGSIAGDVHARNRFGNYIRPRTKPVNPRSDRQESARSIMSYLAEYWHSDLNATQRGLWDTYAASIAMKNRLGETIHLTGFNHFIRSNAARLNIGPPIAAAAPSIPSLPEKDATMRCIEESIADQTFTFTGSNTGWGEEGDGKLVILIYQGQPQLESRNFFDGPWRYMGFISDADPFAAGVVRGKAFSFAVGQKVWFQARVLSVAYRLSNAWTLPPKTIAKDPE